MAYNEKLLRLAAERLAARKSKAEEEARERRNKFAAENPLLAELESKMQRSAYGLIKVIGMGEKTAEYIERLRSENLEAQNEIKRLLAKEGLSEDYLEPHYRCKKCQDTGFKEGRLCSCHLDLLKQMSYEQLCKSSPLKISTFEDFDLSYYKDNAEIYDLMKRNYEFCVNYAANFDSDSANVLMTGETGLGKTHLSLAIAHEVLKKGFGVVYGSVQNLFSNIEREHFGRANEPDGTTEKILLECDLLILDDLGAEFTTSFTVAALNNIINTRLLSASPTIINTNLKINELDSRYSRRINSRLLGEYAILTFAGRDVRQQKNFY